MANIKKNFNFRNGVQVDDDNLLVTATGLVGIGTTIPTEALDVRGNVKVIGDANITQATVGLLTITEVAPVKIIGAGLSVVSGIVTAEGTGILTYFGDASNLLGMPTSQWEDVDVGLGFTSIYNTGGNVGVGTDNPLFTIQAGGNVDGGEEGVGISSAGNIKVSGIITASSFVGDFTGNIVSPSTFSGNVDLNADLDVDGHLNADNVSISGVTTISQDLDVDGHSNLDNVSISGVTTFSSNVDVNADIDIDGHTNLDNLSVAGVSTFTGLVDANGGATIDNIKIGIDTNEEIGTTTGNLTLDSAAGQVIVNDHLSVTGVSTFSNDIGVVGLTTTKTLEVIETSTFGGNLNASFVGASSTVFTTKLGVGTTEAPVNDIQLRKTGDAEIQITSESGIAGITFGRETGNANTNNAEVRYGGGSGFTYSSDTSLDIINYGTGNFNYHLSANNPAGTTGSFFWHKGSNNVRLMTLTNAGRLGIGVTQPTDEIDVAGGVTVSGALSVGGNINLTGTMIGNMQGNVIGNVIGVLAGNTNATVGISTLNNLSVAGVMTSSLLRTNNFAIGENPGLVGSNTVSIRITDTNKILVNDVGQVAIGSTEHLPGITINAVDRSATFGGIGCGVTILGAGIDFSQAGLSTNRFMILPKVNNTQRNNLNNLVSGAIIYNTTTNQVNFFNGTTWKILLDN